MKHGVANAGRRMAGVAIGPHSPSITMTMAHAVYTTSTAQDLERYG